MRALSLAGLTCCLYSGTRLELRPNVHEVYFDDGTIMAQTAVFNSLGGFTNYTGKPTWSRS